MKQESGLVGIAALWLMTAIGTLALATLEMAKWQQSIGRNQTQELKEIYLAQMASEIEADTNFASDHSLREFSTGRVLVDRTFVHGKSTVKFLSHVYCGTNEKTIETGWQRVGDRWRATYWREW